MMPTNYCDTERMNLRMLEPGRAVAGAVCLRRKVTGLTKDGQSFLTIEVGNRTGAVSARVWSEGIRAWDGIDVGMPLTITGTLKPGWKSGPAELVVGSVAILSRPHPVELEINPVCPVPLDTLRERFAHVLAHITPAGQELVRVVLEDIGENDWWTAPAAKVHHHACVHGLAWHSVEVAEIALALGRSTPAAPLLQWDALLVGALLHDAAKVREYRWRGVPIELSREAMLTYHTAGGGVLTMLAVERARERLAKAGIMRADVEHLVHVQLSHHGVAEYGSPVEPRTLEALLVHHADNVSAKVRSMVDDLDAVPADEHGWVTPTGWGRKPVLSLAAAPRVPLRRTNVAPAPVTADAEAEGTSPPLFWLRIVPAAADPFTTTN
jgi:3'-5' exoribonuclease